MPLPTVEHQQGPWVALQEQAGCGALVEGPSPGNVLPLPVTGRDCSHPSCPKRKADTTGSAALCWDVAARGDQLCRNTGPDTLGSSGLEEERSLRRGTAPRARGATKRSPVLAQAQPCLLPSSLPSKGRAKHSPHHHHPLLCSPMRALSLSKVVTKCHFPQGSGDTLCTTLRRMA